MTDAELAVLKEQIKKEIIEEMQVQQPQKIKTAKPWNSIKEIIFSRLTSYDVYNRYQIISAISTIVRHALNINNVSNLKFEDLPRAQAITENILDALENEQATTAA